MATEKDVNRGGTYGQEGEISGPRPTGELNERDKEKQRGGEKREPDLDRKHHIQPKHVVD
jgi:hypothetical protein